jgi:hypothetical protein
VGDTRNCPLLIPIPLAVIAGTVHLHCLEKKEWHAQQEARVREWLCGETVGGTSSLAPLSILMSLGGIPWLTVCPRPCITTLNSQALPLVLWTPIWVFSFCMEHSNMQQESMESQ